MYIQQSLAASSHYNYSFSIAATFYRELYVEYISSVAANLTHSKFDYKKDDLLNPENGMWIDLADISNGLESDEEDLLDHDDSSSDVNKKEINPYWHL